MKHPTWRERMAAQKLILYIESRDELSVGMKRDWSKRMWYLHSDLKPVVWSRLSAEIDGERFKELFAFYKSEEVDFQYSMLASEEKRRRLLWL